MISDRELLSQFYRPDRAGDDMHEILDEAIELRTHAPRIGELAMYGPLHTPRETVIAEVYHLTQTIPDEVMSSGEHDLLAEIIFNQESLVARDIETVAACVDLLRPNMPPSYNDIVLAGMVAAELAHYGVVRTNGKDYYTHPASIAIIIDEAWKLHGGGDDPAVSRDRLLFGALTHDAFEDAQPDDGGTFLSSPNLVVSPLFVKRLFEHYGRDDGDSMADTLMCLTKFQQGPAKTLNEPYIVKVGTSIEAILIKLTDTQHNDVIDPKSVTEVDHAIVARNEQRSFKYMNNQRALLADLADANISTQFMAHYILAVDRRRFNDMRSDLGTVRPRIVMHDMPGAELLSAAQ